MKKRYFSLQCMVITLIACFLLLFQPLFKDQLIQSMAWAGNPGWSDAFGTPSSGKSSPSPRKPDSFGGGSGGNWNTVIDADRYNPVVYDKKEAEKGSPPQPQKQPKSQTAATQIPTPTRPVVFNLIDSLLASNLPAKIPPAVYINNMTAVQYAGAVSMAKEGTRIFYGKMDTEQERLFDARWLPLFRYPSQEIVSYLNQLNPLLVQFLTLRASLNNSIEDFNATQFEVMVTTQIGDASGVSEVMELAVIYATVIKVLNARLQLVAKEIIDLGEPPNAIALMNRARKEHVDAFKEFSKKPRLVKQGCWIMVECKVEKHAKPHVTYLVDKQACRIECTFAPPKPHATLPQLNSYNYIHTWKAPPQRLFLGNQVQLSVSVKNPRENSFKYLSPKEVKKLERPGSSDKYFNYCYCKNNHEAKSSIGIWWNLTYGSNQNLTLPYEISHFPGKGLLLANTSKTKPEDQAFSDPMIVENFQAKHHYKDRLLWLDIGVRNSCYEYKNSVGSDGNETENSANVIYGYKWDPTGGDLEPLDLGEKFAQASAEPLKVSDQNQEEIDPKIVAQNRAEKIIFHQHNIDHFNRNIIALAKELAKTADLERREHLRRDLLYAKDARQREIDAITTIKTGNYVRTRTELDALNLKIMADESREMAEDFHAAKQAIERGPRLIKLAPKNEQEALRKFYYRHVSIENIRNGNLKKLSGAMKALSNRVLGSIEAEIEAHQEEAQYWNENLEMAQTTKSYADKSLMLLSLGGMAAAAVYGQTALITASGITNQVYGAATGVIEGGIDEGVRRAAAGFNTATIIVDAGMRGYENGVLLHLEEYARNPEKITLDEEKAGFKGAAWSAGSAAAFSVAMRFGMKALKKLRSAELNNKILYDQGIHEARVRYHNRRIAQGNGKVQTFNQRRAALAKACREGAHPTKIQELRTKLEQSYKVIKTDYFAKIKMKALAKQADYRYAAGSNSHEMVSAYNSIDRKFTKQLQKRLGKRMSEAGFSKQQYKSFSNSASKGGVGMDVDMGVVEPPRRILVDDKLVHNKAHTRWRESLTRTVNGRTDRISPHDLQKAGHEQLKAAFKDVYGRKPGEAMVEFTTSYHPEAYRDIRWLSGKPGIYSTDRNWTQQAADVTNFKINKLGKDHPSLGYYGNMQENCRGMVKDMNTKLEPMLNFCKNPKAVKHILKAKKTMERFATGEIGPREAEQQFMMLTGNTDGTREISQRFSVMLQGSRNMLPDAPK